ncbi:MFS transporter [Nocardia sp. NPDC050378]|uniref:MFS transporter n=1 Tax=Nocardia sp. NPDC050378 TaxID=3155400 RepID=UPI0033FA7602
MSAREVGMFFGAIAGGRVSDRWGRRPVLIGATVIYSCFSLLTALSPNLETLTVFRLLTGFGLQNMTGVLLVYVSEMFPRHLRGRRYQAILLAIGISGIPVAALVSRLIVPLGPGMWRWIYVVGALGVLGLFLAIRMMPESVRWQAGPPTRSRWWNAWRTKRGRRPAENCPSRMVLTPEQVRDPPCCRASSWRSSLEQISN